MPPTPKAIAGPLPPVVWSAAATAAAGSPEDAAVVAAAVVGWASVDVVGVVVVVVEPVLVVFFPSPLLEVVDDGLELDEGVELVELSLWTPSPNRPEPELPEPPDDPELDEPELFFFFAFACWRAVCTGMLYSWPEGVFGST
jgi:hypothetical protein